MTRFLSVRTVACLLLAAAGVPARGQGGMIDESFGHGGRLALGLGTPIEYSASSIDVMPEGRVAVAGPLGTDVGVTVYTADGTVDALYGAGGRHREALGSGRAVTALPGGGYAMAGRVRPFIDWHLAVVRLLPGGGRDLAFGAAGLVTVEFPDDVLEVYSVVPAGGGRLVVALTIRSHPSLVLLRLQEDGTLDPTFDGDGRRDVQLLTPAGMTVDPAGRLLMAQPVQSGGMAIMVSRMLPDGSPDPAFGAAGTVILSTPSGYMAARHLQALPDGRILIVGHQAVGDGYDGVLVRLLADGSPDPAFGSAGRVTVDFGSRFDGVSSGDVLADGRIVLAGSRSSGSSYDIAIARRLADGSPDASFGSGGLVSLDFGAGVDDARDVVAHPDGALTVIADVSAAGGPPSVLLRFRLDGSLDPVFGDGGVLAAQFVRPTAQVNVMLTTPDDAIYAAGNAQTGTTTGQDYFVARLLATGTRDPSFGSDGVATIDYAGGSDVAHALAVYPDGRILVAGGAGSAGYGVARLLPDGLPDTTFGDGGQTVIAVGAPGGLVAARDVLVEPDGRIVLAGGSVFPSNEGWWQVAVVRLLTDGALDPSFGVGGVVITGAQGSVDRGRALARLPEGGYIVAGPMSVPPRTTPQMAAIRLHPDGMIDSTFGENGYGVAHIGANGSAEAMLLLSDGRILLAGHVDTAGPLYDKEAALLRLTADGQRDASFNGDGLAVAALFYDDEAFDVALLPDGRYAAVGYAERGDLEWAAFVFRDNGSFDTGFGSSGRAWFDFEGGDDVAYAVATQSNGPIVMAGAARIGAGTEAMFVRVLTGPSTATVPAPSPPAAGLDIAPNPARGRVAVQFSLETASSARVSIYDILGREAAVLWDGPAAAGANHATLDAGRLAPGVYVVRVVAGDTVLSRRLTVAR